MLLHGRAPHHGPDSGACTAGKHSRRAGYKGNAGGQTNAAVVMRQGQTFISTRKHPQATQGTAVASMRYMIPTPTTFVHANRFCMPGQFFTHELKTPQSNIDSLPPHLRRPTKRSTTLATPPQDYAKIGSKCHVEAFKQDGHLAAMQPNGFARHHSWRKASQARVL
jgi:hypothetical protein